MQVGRLYPKSSGMQQKVVAVVTGDGERVGVTPCVLRDSLAMRTLTRRGEIWISDSLAMRTLTWRGEIWILALL